MPPAFIMFRVLAFFIILAIFVVIGISITMRLLGIPTRPWFVKFTTFVAKEDTESQKTANKIKSSLREVRCDMCHKIKTYKEFEVVATAIGSVCKECWKGLK
jgi:hypothetical protein